MILLLLATRVAEAPGIPTPDPCPITVELKDQLHAKDDRARAACAVERQLKAAGWEDELVAGAMANAWHESGWNVDARGPGGKAVGFWQLHEDGLGHGMTVAQRADVDLATYKVLDAYDPDERLSPRAPASEHAKQFCLEVMRPKDKRVRAIERARHGGRRPAQRGHAHRSARRLRLVDEPAPCPLFHHLAHDGASPTGGGRGGGPARGRGARARLRARALGGQQCSRRAPT